MRRGKKVGPLLVCTVEGGAAIHVPIPPGYQGRRRQHFAGAYAKGYLARLTGKDRRSCPYDHLDVSPRGVGFGQAYGKCWFEGWDAADQVAGGTLPAPHPTIPEAPPNFRRHFAGAWRKGYRAYLEGRPESACPYDDIMGGRHMNVVTASRAYRRAWLEGWRRAWSDTPQQKRP